MPDLTLRVDKQGRDGETGGAAGGSRSNMRLEDFRRNQNKDVTAPQSETGPEQPTSTQPNPCCTNNGPVGLSSTAVIPDYSLSSTFRVMHMTVNSSTIKKRN